MLVSPILEQYLLSIGEQAALLRYGLANAAVSAEQPDKAALGGMAIVSRRIQHMAEAAHSALDHTALDAEIPVTSEITDRLVP
jgi:hypothetical protein